MKITLDTISRNSEQIFYNLRWAGELACPICGSVHVYNKEAGKLHICADCRSRFSDTSGTIFHSTKLSLSKWLYAIYLFLTSTRGISSYSLARYIHVSQATAWSMLMRIRTCLGQDIKFNSDDVVAIDEMYLGANWTYKPGFKKYKLAGSPPAFYNLNDKDRKAWYKKRFYELAAEDKMPVLGMVSNGAHRRAQISLLYITTNDRKEFVKQAVLSRCASIMKPFFVDEPMTVVTDQSGLYKFFSEQLDHNNRPRFNHQICRHDQNKYTSPDGFSSNRLEAAFSHIRRSWRGVYQFWTRKYTQLYLNEFCFRYNFSLSPSRRHAGVSSISTKQLTLRRLQDFFSRVDPRAFVHFA